MVQGDVCAQFLAGHPALLVGSGDGDDTATHDLADLGDGGADRAGGGGDHQGFTGLGLADIHQPHEGGEARHAEHPEGVADGSLSGIQLEQLAAV